MIDNWKTYKLGEVLEIKYGKDHKLLSDGDIPVYGSGGIMRYGNKALYDQPTILIPRKGTLSNLFYVEQPFWSVDTMFYTKIKEGSNPKFIYYYLKTLNLAALNVGSAVPSLTTEVLKKVEIQLPNLEVQNEIVKILSPLDDKIELNNQVNQTLEAMAQAIFKEWFVDFKFPGFDGQLVDGLPKGWSHSTLGEFTKMISKGTTPTAKEMEGLPKEIKFLKVKDVSQDGLIDSSSLEYIPYSVHIGRLKRSILFENDILFSIAGTIGRVAILPGKLSNANCNQALAFIRLNDSYHLEFIHQNLKSIKLQSDVLTKVVQGVQANVSLTVLSNLRILKPTDIVLDKWVTAIRPIYNKISSLNKNNENLKELRDTLLPKLMKGKIEVKL